MLCIFSLSYSQDSITTGFPYTVIDGQYKIYFEKNEKLLSIKVEAKRIFIQVFDVSTLKLVKRTHFDLSGNQTLEKVSEINGRYFIFYSAVNYKENNVHLFCKEINIESASFMDQRFILKSKLPLYPIQSLYAEAVTSLANEKNQDNSPVFNFNYSQDNSKMCMHYHYVNSVDKQTSLIGIHVLDQDFNVISSKEIEVPYRMQNIIALDYALDKSGTLYMAWNSYEESVPWYKRTIRSDAPYQTSIWVFPWNSTSFSSTTFELTDKKVSRLRFVESNNVSLTIAGYYYQEGTPVCIKGFFRSSVDYGTGRVGAKICHNISNDILNPYEDSKKKIPQVKVNYYEDLVLKKVIALEDNSLLLIGEQVYDIEKTKSYPDEQKQIDFNNHYNDILVIKLDSFGYVSWIRRLPKRQVGGKVKGGMSYRHITLGENHFFLFLDNVKNISLASNVRPTQHVNDLGGHLTYYKIENGSGNLSKKNLLDMRSVNGISLRQFSSNRITKINQAEFILELYKGENEDILVKVKLR